MLHEHWNGGQSQEREAPVRLQSLQKVVRFDVGVAVVAVFNPRAFAKESVRFVEKQNRGAAFRRIEDAPKILFRLAYIFRNHRAQMMRKIFFRSRARV